MLATKPGFCLMLFKILNLYNLWGWLREQLLFDSFCVIVLDIFCCMETTSTTNLICIKTQTRFLSLCPEKIIFCRAEGSYTRVVLEDNSQELVLSKPLHKLHECFNDQVFLRCHNSFLVNMSKIQSFDSKQKCIKLNGHILPVSRRKTKQIYRILSEMGVKDNKIVISHKSFWSYFKR